MSNVTKIELSNRNISDVDDIFEQLKVYAKDIIELDISNNQITKLPNNLSGYMYLEKLDITNNPFNDFNSLGLSLSTLPRLVDLKISLSNKDEAIGILTNLPNILYLNGKSTKYESNNLDIEENEIESISLNNEIENFNNIFNRINDKLKTTGIKDAVSVFCEKFQKTLKNEIEKINSAVDESIPNYVYASNVIMSKISIYSFFQAKLISMLQSKDPTSVSILNETNKHIQLCVQTFMDILNKLQPRIEEKNEQIKKNVEETITMTYKPHIEELESQISILQSEKDQLIRFYEDEKKFLSAKLEKLDSENKMITEQLLKKAKEIGKEHYNSYEYVRSEKSSAELLNKSRVLSTLQLGPVSVRALTKNMLLEIINDIYNSKHHYDKKCLESNIPRETMEQHMYTYLNQKYGLKNLIIEWAASIINGIRMYSYEDSDILLFGKVLRNEIEEEAVGVIARLKSTIADLLTYLLKSKNPLKSNGEIKDLAMNRFNGNLSEDEWKSVIYCVYEKDDANLLEMKIYEHVKKRYLETEKVENLNKKLTRDEVEVMNKIKEDWKIPYNDFIKIILDFQIISRDKYLSNFTLLFRRVDSDNNGIIEESEFIQLIEYMDIYRNNFEEFVKRVLNILDPNNNKVFTYSDLVNFFSKEFTETIDEKGNRMEVNILDKISLDTI